MRIKTGNVESFEEDPGQNRVSPLASALSGISDALKQSPATTFPRKWEVLVERDSSGEISAFHLEALD